MNGGPSESERRFDLLAVGDPVLDVVVQAASLPGWDDKHLAQSAQIMPGGCECNAACAASRLGARSAVCGQVGTGPEAQLLVNDLVRFGVNTDHLGCEPGTATSTAVVYVSPRGERAVSYAAASPRVQRWDRLERAISQSRWVYLLPYDPDWAARVVALARKHHTAVAFDLERAVVDAAGSFRPLAPLADCIFFNEGGFQRATREPATLANARALLDSTRAQTLVVTLGERGALAVNRANRMEQVDATAARVCDTTGAGDCFNGAFLAACLRGACLRAALEQASAAASLCIASRGARAGLPTLSELTLHMAQQSPAKPAREGHGA